MAKKNNNILLAGAVLAGAYFLSKDDKKEYKATDGTVFSTEEEMKAYEAAVAAKNTAQQEATTAKHNLDNYKAVEAAKKELDKTNYAKKVILTDVTMQYFNDGNPHNGLVVAQFPYNYIIWARFRNTSDINVLIDITDVTATIVHTTNNVKLPINRNKFVISSKTETKWLPIVVATESVVKGKKYYDDTVLLRDIKENFPRRFNFFLPCHVMVKYNVEIPNQNTILAKDVLGELNCECLSLNTKGDAGWWGLSTTVFNKAYTQFITGGYGWVEKSNRTTSNAESSHINGNVNMLNPSNNTSYQSYLDVLRDKRFKRANAPYKDFPTRYTWLKDYEQGTKTKASYGKNVYKGGKFTSVSDKVYHPYAGVVYDKNGIVAYE